MVATAAVPVRVGELLAVIGPAGPQRAAYVLALAEALGGVSAQPAPAGAEAWRNLRRLVETGATVVAPCACVADANPYAHRTVLLPAD
jgi:hypothetical protein